MAKKVFPGLTKGIEIGEDGEISFLGPLDVAEQAIPGAPDPGRLRLYVENISGFLFLSFVDGTGMRRKIVRDSVFVAKNNTGDTIPANRAVYSTGSDTGVPTVARARANSINTMPSVGVTLEAIADGGFGRVMQVGLIENVNTSAFAEGTVLYVSSAAAGVLVATAPLYPNIRQEIGVILISDAVVGTVQLIARSMFNEGILDHGGLLGLADGDDHTQYVLVDGTRKMTGGLEIDQDTAGEPALTLDQGDVDDVFVNFVGTSAADQTKSISTADGDGAMTGPHTVNLQAGWEFEGMARVEINGVMKWVAYYVEVE